ncbi:hypothetical protein C1645_832242 [Glomus cerebriforme]|uniref:Uncharacterized protein n=1 Tax=Glomus cerebriforme TaxID=658196 RepID=A0A397SEL4_9GLOM|nr:hypothetical protein C1645_832242 [Glomus cerebriforme]
MEKQEKEFYSKLQVAGSIKFISKKSNEFIGLKKLKLTNNEKFSHNLATILVRKEEVVAVNLTTYSNYCIIYISKNSNWLKEAFKKNDTKALSANIIAYCSEKFDLRLKKLKRDIRDGKNNQYIQSFLKYASNLVNINNVKASKIIISKPIITYQSIFSWRNIIQRFILDPMKYENFKNICLSNRIKADKLATIYEQGYNIIISGAYRKIYNLWKLPSSIDITFKSNFLLYALKELDQIIQKEVNSISCLLPKFNCDENSMSFDQINNDDENNANLDFELSNIQSFLTYK